MSQSLLSYVSSPRRVAYPSAHIMIKILKYDEWSDEDTILNVSIYNSEAHAQLLGK